MRMSFVRLLALTVVCAGLLGGCSKTPTAPSPASSQIVLGSQPALTAPPAPRISLTPPRGIGVSRIVAFGDSITWGAYSSYDPRFLFAAANGGYPERLAAGLNVHHAPQRFTVFNEGVPGEWASAPGTLTRLRTTLTSRQAQALLLLEGINDLSNDHSVSATAAGLGQLINAATAMGVPVIVATMFQTYVSTSPEGSLRTNGASRVAAYNQAVRQLAAGRVNVHLLDLEPMMNNRSYVGNDGVHLTDAGFEVMASAFMNALEKAFPVRGSFQ
jgi:lysophospholipase L1-like esterase